MHEKEPNKRQNLLRSTGAAVAALGFLLLISRFLPTVSRPVSDDTGMATRLRQGVVIFLVDTTDYFDAHGVYVHSVMRQHCPRCEVQPVNLHGNLSLPHLIEALRHIQQVTRAYDATTTALVNLSLGTYTDDETLHAIVRTLDAQGAILIASAGNDNTSKPFYPAAFDEVLSVCSSTRHTQTRAAYSNFGTWVSLCAPGLQYVTRPLRPGGLASGTSFASPMVAGVLGQLLLNAPCVTPRTGRRALLRTANPVAIGQSQVGAGILNPIAAGQYLRSLYPCEEAISFRHKLLGSFKRLGTRVGISLGLIVYFFASIFTLPLLLAFVIERWQRRAERRQQAAVQQAYAGSLDDRRQRLLELQQEVQRRHRVRQRHQAELYALLDALQAYGEPCWWCGKAPADPTGERSEAQDIARCRRCGLALDKALPLS
ncbi:hypothetical protein NKDENANG_03031 [Candidatus Entotheonellaceae bacterium PAL068K]